MKKIIYALSVASALALTRCATIDGGYTQSSVGQVKSVKRGTVLEVRNITIGDDYKGAAAEAVLGAIAGGSFNKDAGQELVIKYDNGDTVTTVCRVDKDAPFMFRSGDRVGV